MGVVFVAEQFAQVDADDSETDPEEGGRPVALKVLNVRSAAGGSEVMRFREEMKTLGLLTHPNIVRIYDSGIHQGRPFFAMQLLEGGSLQDRLPDFRGNRRAAVRLIAKLARALAAVHGAAVLHRDITPRNILFDSSGEPYLTDFGIARLISPSADGLTQTGVVVGTPKYMAPERFKIGTTPTVGVDIWSLGVILFQVLTGREPFASPEEAESGLRPQLPSSVDKDLKAICHKCIERAPGDRFQSAHELANDLDNWLAGKLVGARHVSLMEQLVKWLRRHPWRAAFWIATGFGVTAPITVFLSYVLLINWLRSSFRVRYFDEAGTVTLDVVDHNSTKNRRCTENFDARHHFLFQARRVRFELVGFPEDLPGQLQFIMRSDWAGLPDPARHSGLKHGDVVTILNTRDRVLADVSYYFTDELWPEGVYGRIGPAAQIRLQILD